MLLYSQEFSVDEIQIVLWFDYVKFTMIQLKNSNRIWNNFIFPVHNIFFIEITLNLAPYKKSSFAGVRETFYK